MTLDGIIGIANLIGDSAALVALAFSFYVRNTASAAADKRCAETEKKLDATTNALYQRLNGYGDRIMHLEGVVDDMPRLSDVHEVSLKITEVTGELKAINARMAGIEQSSAGNAAALRRVENHLFKVEGS